MRIPKLLAQLKDKAIPRTLQHQSLVKKILTTALKIAKITQATGGSVR